MQPLQTLIETTFDHQPLDVNRSKVPDDIRAAVTETLRLLGQGKLRVATKENGHWVTHEWLKKAILLAFQIYDNQIIPGFNQFFDKIPLKFNQYSAEELTASGVRIVPPACVREGAYIGPKTVLMPSYVNIGAYVDSGTMIDTWATIGSCAQIGKNVHISGGTGIGGILEPLNATPTIIEDNCFIGARSEVVEGVIVEENAVISMGVFIGQSTPIYNRMTEEISYGLIPKGAVVIPGSLPADNGKFNRYAAIIIKQVDAKTRKKLALNDLLRDNS